MIQGSISTTENLGKALESARKNSKRAARKLSDGHRLLSLAMLDQGRTAQPAVDRAFVQHGGCF